jgi:CDP-diglyceride synthetase
MKKAIEGAVIGCVFAFTVLFVLGLLGFKFNELWLCHIFTVFAIVGAVAGGTGAILARLDQMRIP